MLRIIWLSYIYISKPYMCMILIGVTNIELSRMKAKRNVVSSA